MDWHDFQSKIRSLLRNIGLLPKGDSLLKYRMWVSFVAECSDLYDDLEHLKKQLPTEQSQQIEHVCDRLLGIFERSDVEVIRGKVPFDRYYHLPIEKESIQQEQPIEIVSPGLAIGRRVLRRAQVVVSSQGPKDNDHKEEKNE